MGVVAIGSIARKIAECSGPDVGKRFLEVTPDYTAEGLRNWIMRYPSQARRYAFPVLFPLDILLLIAVVGFLAVASLATARALHWTQGWLWIVVIFPLLYGLCDFIENVFLTCFMVAATTVTDTSVAIAQRVTGLKFATLVVSALQLVALLVSWLLGTLAHALH